MNIYESATTYSVLYIKPLKYLQLRTSVPGVNPSVICAPYRVSISTSNSIVDGLFCKNLTESLVYMARKHGHAIEKRSLYSQNVLCYFFMTLVCTQSGKIFCFFLQLFEVIWKTATNPGETFTLSVTEKYEFFALYPMKFDLV